MVEQWLNVLLVWKYKTKVLISDGSSKHDSYTCKEIGYLICQKHFFTPMRSLNWYFFFLEFFSLLWWGVFLPLSLMWVGVDCVHPILICENNRKNILWFFFAYYSQFLYIRCATCPELSSNTGTMKKNMNTFFYIFLGSPGQNMIRRGILVIMEIRGGTVTEDLGLDYAKLNNLVLHVGGDC